MRTMRPLRSTTRSRPLRLVEHLESRNLLTTIDLATLPDGSANESPIGAIVLHGIDIEDESGFSVSGAGDINGDGFDDVIIGAPLADGESNGHDRSGESYVVFGRSDFSDSTIELAELNSGPVSDGFVMYGVDEVDRSGHIVLGAGDVNGDGFDDLMIGAYDTDGLENSRPSSGETYIVFGRADWNSSLNLDTDADVHIVGADSDDLSGQSLANVGDVNGDGFDDLLIGAHRANGLDNQKSAAGDAHLVLGRPDWSATPVIDLADTDSSIVFHGVERLDFTARNLSGAGDVNGDGLADFLITSLSGNSPLANRPFAGKAFLVFGKTDWDSTPVIELADLGEQGVTFSGIDPFDRTGSGVAGVGDVNGDGIDDLALGAPGGDGPDNSADSSGETYLIFGRNDWSATPTLDLADDESADVTFLGIDVDDFSGLSLSGGGDFNGDGFDDLVIAAASADGESTMPRQTAGESFVVFGKPDWLETPLVDLANGDFGLTFIGADANDRSGEAVRFAGDVNGDGYGDLLIGSPGGDAGVDAARDAGKTHLILGADFSGTTTHSGTNGDDVLEADDTDDIVVAGAGNDRISGGGGADVLLGGAGDDHITIADLLFRRIDGGNGFDTLAIDPSGESEATDGMVFDLSTVSNNRLRNVEQIELNSVELQVSQRDVLNLSHDSNTLQVIGGPENRLTLVDSNWVRQANVELAEQSFAVFTNGAATIHVTTEIATVTHDSDPPVIRSVRVASSTGAVDDWDAGFLSEIDSEMVGYVIPSGVNGLNQTGQLTPLTWNNIRQVVIEFSEDVGEISSTDIQLLGATVAEYSFAQLEYDAANYRAIATLPMEIEIDKLLLVVRDSVSDLAGNSLDGEWVNGVSIGDSGDGSLGGDFEFRFNVVPGDTDGTGVVSVLDVAPLRRGLGAFIGQPNYSAIVDFNGSGSIAVNDVAPIRENLGLGLPETDPLPLAARLASVPLSANDLDEMRLEKRQNMRDLKLTRLSVAE